MKKVKEPRFTNARKRDLGDFVMRQLVQRDATLTANQIRKVCSHLYTRLRTKEGAKELARQRELAAGWEGK